MRLLIVCKRQGVCRKHRQNKTTIPCLPSQFSTIKIISENTVKKTRCSRKLETVLQAPLIKLTGRTGGFFGKSSLHNKQTIMQLCYRVKRERTPSTTLNHGRFSTPHMLVDPTQNQIPMEKPAQKDPLKTVHMT